MAKFVHKLGDCSEQLFYKRTFQFSNIFRIRAITCAFHIAYSMCTRCIQWFFLAPPLPLSANSKINNPKIDVIKFLLLNLSNDSEWREFSNVPDIRSMWNEINSFLADKIRKNLLCIFISICDSSCYSLMECSVQDNGCFCKKIAYFPGSNRMPNLEFHQIFVRVIHFCVLHNQKFFQNQPTKITSLMHVQMEFDWSTNVNFIWIHLFLWICLVWVLCMTLYNSIGGKLLKQNKSYTQREDCIRHSRAILWFTHVHCTMYNGLVWVCAMCVFCNTFGNAMCSSIL